MLSRLSALGATLVVSGVLFAAGGAHAQAIGDPITNPTTGAVLTVTDIVPNGVIATGDVFILTSTTVGAILPDPANPALTVEIASVVTNVGTGLIERVVFTDARTLDVVAPLSTAPSAPPGGSLVLAAGAGDSNQFSDIRRASGGGGGRDGALFVSANPGGPGGPGANFGVTIGSGYGTITTVSNGLPGVIVASIGGNGGSGGDGYLGASGARGGEGGAGGNVSINSYITGISTTGTSAHGLVAQSRSGVGGPGGSGFLFSSGGSGGAGNDGGNATATNQTGTITTRGDGAHGVFAQSLGGGAGSGGGSYGLFGSGGNGNNGGDGGAALAVNYGQVTTFGAAAHGVTAQSIGGIGGDAGNAVGLITFTSAGAAGGNGGSAVVRAQTGSQTRTEGAASFGLFAQSVGGGGGSGGVSAGLVALGSSGGTGGNGGVAQIFTQSGSFVTTTNLSSHAIFAQSIGGGGGNGGVTGGLVAVGAQGNSGGTGGDVTVESGATVATSGIGARGIFAQSVGGGGGSALGTGGLVALGGSGAGAGGAGVVTVSTLAGSSVTTTQRGADGIFAQSVGGGGGAGSTSGGVVALGGTAGAGGNGNTVTVTNYGSISTGGSFARGIFAQSVGGGGGSGGDSGGLVALGGDGAAASFGGTVTVNNHGVISTALNIASAIQAQSIGGGGGDGGTTGGVFLTIGGDGGGGGNAGVVTVNNFNNLTTGGNDSHGLFAQSVGGGGGNGGASVSVSAFAGVAIGGAGDAGGDGGQVNLNFFDRIVDIGGVPTSVLASIETTGERSRGVYAQSVGGGGGSGGFAVQTSIGFGGAVSVAVGGSGAGGGTGGEVNVNGDVAVHTGGDYSEGMLIQSVGGGGGAGGFGVSVAIAGGPGAASLSAAVGGSGAGGGAGGLVTMDAGGSIVTEGQFSTGLLAQSVGGGGGSGGFTVSASVAGAPTGSLAVAVGVGGSGGAGGLGGTVDATFDGAIRTVENDARGAVIQSVGGGGGNGGFNVSGAVGIGGVGGAGAAVGVGGSGGAGGAGGFATGHIGGAVDTTGDRSTGVTVQSVGGGGGSGGFNISGSIGGGGQVGVAASIGVGGSGDTGGAGGTVIASARDIITRGEQAGGFLAQSVGGGGGSGGMNVSGNIAAGLGAGSLGISVGVGGAGGGGGDGGQVTAGLIGDVTTGGADSDGIVAQSVGGGGGGGGLNVSAGLSVSGGTSGAIGVGVGGNGGLGGDAANATLTVTGTTRTAGLNSDGIIVQSVGGGGGGGGVNVTGNVALSTSAAGTIGVGVGGSGGGGGDSLAATLNLNQGVVDTGNTLLAVATTGDNASGIVVQSVAGGGGSGAVNVTGALSVSSSAAANIGVGVGGFGGDGGNSGVNPLDVVASAFVNGDVVTTGNSSSAIFVQSLGGGGGNGGVNVTAGISGSTSTSGNLMVGVGGFGGDGGNAGAVVGNVTSDIWTGTLTPVVGGPDLITGHGSSAVTFQSLGGGGGNGAINVAGGLSIGGGTTGTLAVGIGGFAGGGGDASTVNATFNGSIQTLGDQAHGLLLQSLGGGGGNGGINVTGAVSLAGGAGGAVGFGLGGFGGDGGIGRRVDGFLTGHVVTYGADSFGAVLQSLGGGGGNGALNVTGTLAATVDGGGSVGIGIGGFGGAGGASGSVFGVVNGNYTTHGANAGGVLAQSQAGGGGNGGLNVSAAVQLGLGNGAAGSVGIGGFGGTGASTAGEVVLNRTGNTVTLGAGSDGVTAQSLGGGGGNGGINISAGVSATLDSGASLGFGLGGFGGDGGDSGAVRANIQGHVLASGLASDVTVDDIVVTIDLGPVFGGGAGGLNEVDVLIPGSGRQRLGGSNGVVVQSQGGGGGVGGLNVTGQLAIGGDSGRAVALGIGGFGGSGGDAGTAHLTLGSLINHVQVQGIGDERSAVIVQSVGGGGGVGGINVSGGISTNGNLVAGIGGFGGDGGLGRAVTANIHADLFAAGNLSRGLLAQSVGGGGGHGGINVSAGINAAGTANTGNDSSLVFGLGGFGGAGNASGNVTVSHNGQVSVEGEGSVGLLVQSVAGGGGSGGLNVSGNLALGGSDGFGVAIGIGGSGGTGADAGVVTLNSTGDIYARTSTPIPDGASPLDSRHRATSTAGIIAQSIGGGGGQGGVNITGAIARSGSPIAVGVGGSGGSGGNANDVTVTRGYVDNGAGEVVDHRLIRTYGNEGVGLLAQSVGGGGGNAGVNLVLAGTNAGDDNPVSAIIAVGGSGAGAGVGTTVTVRHHGDIVTDGDSSGGLLAQSIGGGGGNANFNVGLGYVKGASALNLAVGGATGAAGNAGLVTVDHVGTILTEGDDSAGLTAQSLGGGGGSVALSMAMGLGSSRGLNIAIGREGGTGGTGGDVSINADGYIGTLGDRSTGILGQSVGGGGGTSGSTSVGVTSASGTGTSERGYQGSVAVGLTGGTGATAGAVDITSSADVVTGGNSSHAIHAQSTGGGGGVGGSAMNTLIRQSGSFTVGVGGDGGTGNDSGVVTVVSNGTLVTEGDASDGIFAQSIGGGGGVGGYSALLAFQAGGAASNGSSNLAVNVGGSGGNGSSGQAVDVTNRGAIATTGERSFGIRAQSIGGGGGDGGMVIGLRAQGSGDNMSAEFRVGGSGASAGAGRNVDVINEGLIVTTGRESAGISANSIGGGGGNGGLVVDAIGGAAGAGNTTGRFIVNIGGSGGTGGTSGDVTVTNRTTAAANSGTILTTGADAYGILAQSLSGGGGNGSSVISLTAMSSGSDSGTFGLNIGGAGGAANQAGTVHVINGGVIETVGSGAHGILAQSIGGGGGNGGLSLAGSLLIGAATNTPLISVGGAGGDGGNANTVTVDNTGNILTHGVRAHGIVAQSIGGGGGNANMGISASGNIVTAVASNAISAIVGAVSSGNGGLGGEVVVNHSGDITVLGDGSQAIKAESINGGGGSLTFDFDGIISAPGRPFAPPASGPSTDPLVSARLGGESVSDMSGGQVTVNSSGTFGAAGNNGAGAVAQSIGGGGGTADVLLTLGVETPTPAPVPGALSALPAGPMFAPAAPVDLDFALGGVNGVNNHGAALSTAHSGSILTTGTNSPGVLMQSIGGGGGRSNIGVLAPTGSLLGTVNLTLGGTNGTNETGGTVHRDQTGAVMTIGDLSPGVHLQSIGGGGGSVGLAVSGDGSLGSFTYTSLGSAGGTQLGAGAVSGSFSGGIVTAGDRAIGLLAQSIGAGGGDVRSSGTSALDATLGGSAGASGNGGAITLTNVGGIETAGIRSHGVLLQSIGGGGGSVVTTTSIRNISLSNQNTGNGGAISFTQTGNIVVAGTATYGLVAQSLGGGGGWVDGAFAGTAGGAGRGGAVTLTVTGDIHAAEAGSTGVLAQSLGRDGAGDISTFVTGAVRGGSGAGMGVMFDGGLNNRLVTSGSVSAVSGLAVNATGGNDTVVNTGTVVGNIDLGAGSNAFNNETGATFIAFNTIDLRDPVAPPAPLAPAGKGGSAEVIPAMAGVIDGPQVLPAEGGTAKGGNQPEVLPALAAGPGPLAAPLPVVAATFSNAGNFVMGLSAPRFPLDLANGDVFGNLDDDGSPQTNLLYGARVTNTVDLDGHYLQTADGNLVFDVAFGPYASDVVNVSGNTTVDGTGQVILTWLENSDPYTLFATAGTAVDNGLEIDDTLAIDFGIIANDLGIQLTIATDFGQPFLNANERSLGGHMDSAISVGGSGGIGRLMALIGNLQAGEEDTYAAIFDQLNPEPHVAPTYRQLVAAEDFSQQLFSCPGRVSRLEDNCAWARVETASTDRTGDFENYGVEGQTMQFRGGFEHRLDSRWSLAGAVGYDRLDRLHVDGDRAHTEGDGVHAGLGVRRAGPAGDDVGVSLSGGWQWLESERQLNVFQPGVGSSSPETGYLQIEAHAARVFTHEALFLRPALTATYTALRHAGLTETGLDGLGVEVLEETQYIGSITPELGVGATMQDDARGYAAVTFTVGQVFRSDEQLVLPMRLLGSNPAADPAQIATALDDQALRLAAELRVARASGLEVRLGYTAELSDSVHNHTAGINLKMPF